MEIKFNGIVNIYDGDIEDMAKLVVNNNYSIADAIDEVLAGYDDSIFYAGFYFWDELAEQVKIKMEEIKAKPKMRTVRFTAYIDLPVENEDEFYDLDLDEIDFNECRDVEFDEIISED